MDTPRHHLDDGHLLDYAAGNAPAALGLTAAVHLAYCLDCTGRVGDLDAAAGAIGAPAAPSALARARLLDSVAAAPPPAPAPAEDPRLRALGIPQVLRHHVPPGARLHFRGLLPGMRVVRLRVADADTRARLVRFRPGFAIPRHDHGGDEYAVVMRGSFTDGDERYARGDVCVRGPGAPHRLRVDPGEPCLALLVNRGGVVWPQRLARMIERLLRP